LDIQEVAPWPRGGGINPSTNNPEIANHGNINFAPKLCENPRMPKPTRSVKKNNVFKTPGVAGQPVSDLKIECALQIYKYV